MQQTQAPRALFRNGASYGTSIFKVGPALTDGPGISSHLVPQEATRFFTHYPAGQVVRTALPCFVFGTFEAAVQFLLKHPHPWGQIWEGTIQMGGPAPSRVFSSQRWQFWPTYWDSIGRCRWDPALAWEPSQTQPTEPDSLLSNEIRLDRLIDPFYYTLQQAQTTFTQWI